MVIVAQTYADSVGHFEFRNLQRGYYHIVVELEGYQRVSHAVDLTTAASGFANVTIAMNRTLTERVVRAPGFEGEDPDIVDARVLSASYPPRAVREYERAIEETQRGNGDRAIRHLEEAVRLAPDFYHAFNNLGVALQRAGRHADAEEAFLRANQISPNSQQPILNLAVLWMTQAESSDPDEAAARLRNALGMLDKAVAIRPRAAAAHYYRGAAQYRLGMLDEAESALLRALDADRNFGAARLMLSNVYVKQTRWDLALEQLDAYLAEHPDAPDRPAVEDTRAKIIQRRGPGSSV
jgi:tetratricopeptide (TPR) repeat protein